MGELVEMVGLTKRYGGATALDAVDLTVRTGEVLGLLGPNGAGKTTTVRLLLGLIRPSAGAACIAGHDCWHQRVAAHRHVAYVPGEVNLWPQLTGGEVLELLANLAGGRGRDEGRRAALVERFGLDPRKRCRSYSKGNRQKVALIAAFGADQSLLLLDEPTSGLDPLMEVTFRECVAEARAEGRTVLLSSHILSEVQALCDRIAILREGRLVEVGTLEEMRHLTADRVEITFDGPMPDLTGTGGVDDVVVDGRVVRLRLHGSPAELLAAVAPCRPVAFSSRPADLEELFLSFYGGDDHAR